MTRGWEQEGVRIEEEERIQGSSEQWKWGGNLHIEKLRGRSIDDFFPPVSLCVCVCARCQPTGQSSKKNCLEQQMLVSLVFFENKSSFAHVSSANAAL